MEQVSSETAAMSDMWDEGTTPSNPQHAKPKAGPQNNKRKSKTIFKKKSKHHSSNGGGGHAYMMGEANNKKVAIGESKKTGDLFHLSHSSFVSPDIKSTTFFPPPGLDSPNAPASPRMILARSAVPYDEDNNNEDSLYNVGSFGCVSATKKACYDENENDNAPTLQSTKEPPEEETSEKSALELLTDPDDDLFSTGAANNLTKGLPQREGDVLLKKGGSFLSEVGRATFTGDSVVNLAKSMRDLKDLLGSDSSQTRRAAIGSSNAMLMRMTSVATTFSPPSEPGSLFWSTSRQISGASNPSGPAFSRKATLESLQPWWELLPPDENKTSSVLGFSQAKEKDRIIFRGFSGLRWADSTDSLEVGGPSVASDDLPGHHNKLLAPLRAERRGAIAYSLGHMGPG